MSINMANVKSITLGGVSVKKIEDTNGNVLWGGSTTATINLTVGSGQDINQTQYYNKIYLPSKSTIKAKIASKTGISSGSINITKVEIDLSTLYWYCSDSQDYFTPYLAWANNYKYILEDSAGTRLKGVGIRKWGTSYYNATSQSGSLYGFRRGDVLGEYSFNDSSSSGSRFCTSSSSSTLPTYTIRVTYEY